jgi:prepilin-type N-terminal cleavage/methylation domain-containing protein
MMQKTTSSRWHSGRGFSVTELVVVVGIVAILSALAIPQMVGQRRLMRSHAVIREIMTQLRYTRQLAMSQRQAFTFQYDDANKRTVIIDHNASGTGVLLDATYPNTAVSTVVRTTPLTQGGLSSSELAYGIPTSLPTAAQGALGDGTSRTNLASNKVNVTFQPDGSVIDANGNPLDRAIFLYNSTVPSSSAAAISVIGSSGRAKIWRFDGNANKYIE